jgi:hypothetical protein
VSAKRERNVTIAKSISVLKHALQASRLRSIYLTKLIDKVVLFCFYARS